MTESDYSERTYQYLQQSLEDLPPHSPVEDVHRIYKDYSKDDYTDKCKPSSFMVKDKGKADHHQVANKTEHPHE